MKSEAVSCVMVAVARSASIDLGGTKVLASLDQRLPRCAMAQAAFATVGRTPLRLGLASAAPLMKLPRRRHSAA